MLELILWRGDVSGRGDSVDFDTHWCLCGLYYMGVWFYRCLTLQYQNYERLFQVIFLVGLTCGL